MIYLTKIEPAENMARFYVLDLQPTLFGEWVLMKEWGRIGQAGQCRNMLFKDLGEAKAALEQAIKRRVGRAYTPLAA